MEWFPSSEERIEEEKAIADLMTNPRDGRTWLGLLQIRGELHGEGYGSRALADFEQRLQERGVRSYKIGVLTDNDPAHAFWTRKGFRKTGLNPDGTIVVYEKELAGG
ncbi:GNAT family N-acetyltransferase [Paenibacillus antri]|uniref:GNAT family N-acetyltransferase n=1 Tax=Paenibacillus antri TaxID=2582848 RepID=A0A5R9G924_9BACL|nr:GNAT family N-acetyltransferase [Paenibacillus antri]TLS51579.1 GNAT family N-acetyltransferase [Paenibacillus antri]